MVNNSDMLGVRDAVDLLHAVLPPASDRLAHTLAVGQKATEIAGVLGITHSDRLVAAAYLHDVGYAETAVQTGMHQLDGARFLRDRGFSVDLCRLVAHHTFARIEARNKVLGAVLEEEFPLPEGNLARVLDLVSYCDLTTNRRGEPVSVDSRFADIFDRYDPGHVVERTMREAEPLARDLVAGIDTALHHVTTSRPATL